MRIANNVEMLALKTTLANGPGVIHPLLIWDEKDVVLFDAGLPGMGAIIRQAAADALIPFERLTKVLITHSDMDHIGGLSQIAQEADAGITVSAHREEKPYIECALPPIRLKQMEAGLSTMKGELHAQMETLTEKLRQNYLTLRVAVDKTIEDGEVLPFCGGITGIHSPGHTPGHMCYYLKKHKILIAGDILQVENGSLAKCPEITILDHSAVTSSLTKLSQYNIETVVCYHGGLFRGDVSQQIAKITDG